MYEISTPEYSHRKTATPGVTLSSSHFSTAMAYPSLPQQFSKQLYEILTSIARKSRREKACGYVSDQLGRKNYNYMNSFTHMYSSCSGE